jgi:hypothetical protein
VTTILLFFNFPPGGVRYPLSDAGNCYRQVGDDAGLIGKGFSVGSSHSGPLAPVYE